METDWTQFWPSMIATFVGFVLALFGQWFFVHLKEINDIKELKGRIARELCNIKNALENFSDTALDVQPLKTPAWNAAINAGQVSLLDVGTRESFFCVYNAIQEFNSWCLVQTNYYFDNEKFNSLLTDEISKLKKELLSNKNSASSRSIMGVLCDMKQKGEYNANRTTGE